MLLQSVKLSGISALLAGGLVGTVVWAQQGKNGAAGAGDQQAGVALTSDEKKPSAPVPREKQGHRPDPDQRNKQILKKLDMRIDLDLGEVQLDQLLKEIKQATTDASFPGIPIYIDPIDIQESGHSLATIVPGQYKQQRVWNILDYALRPNGLGFTVKDGYMTIGTRSHIVEQRLEEVEAKLDRVLEALDRLERGR